MTKEDLTIKSEKCKTIIKLPGDIDGNEFTIKDLLYSNIVLLDHIAQITIEKCKNSKFYIGPVKAIVVIKDCQNCEFTVSCA